MYNPKLQFHFTGIGGSGMSGIAEILLGLGFGVSGSDLVCSDICKRLEDLGARISYGHCAKNLPLEATLLVHSAAVRPNNVEVGEARRRGLPVVRRAEVLAELMRLKYGVAVAGSHGKTTTTTMTAAVLEEGGLDPTVVIGGVVMATGSGGRLGKGNYLVAESDESDRSFLLLRPTIAVVTNIDYEHIGAYQSFADLENSFEQFAQSIPFYGLAVLGIDNPRVKGLAERFNRRCVTYGFSADAAVRALNVELSQAGSTFDVLCEGEFLGRFELPLVGRHMVQNSLAAVAVGREFGISSEIIKAALQKCSAVRRRMELVGQGGGVTALSDYAHHPTEIKTTLEALRESWQGKLRRLHVVFQPHRFSRTKECWDLFADAFAAADTVAVADVYPAGEEPIPGVSAAALCEVLRGPVVRQLPLWDELNGTFFPDLTAGDVIMFMGAGSIGPQAVAFGQRLSGGQYPVSER